MALNRVYVKAKPKVAVIGAGLAGLSAAWLLRKQYDVTLYERHESAGMGVFTADYASNGINTRIDIPLRIFTPSYYPSLFSLYRYLDIEMEQSNHASAFQYLTNSNQIKPFFEYKNIRFLNLKFSTLALNSFNKTGFTLAYYQYRFFKKIQKDIILREDLARITFKDYLAENEFNKQFIRDMLMPALAVTLTCNFDSVGQYPADLILDYLTCGVMQEGIVRAKQGVDGIVPKLTQGYDVKCAHEVTAVKSQDDKVELSIYDLHNKNQINKTFDHVIVASQADVAAKILSSIDGGYEKQATLLKCIPLEESTMILHTDTGLMSNVKSASPVSYLLSNVEPRAATTVDLTKAFSTYKRQQPVFQTWHPIKQPTKASVIAQAQFTRPLVTLDSRQAVAQLQALNQNSQVKICGSYMANRFPLLDAAVESSVAIARQMGVIIPWEAQDDVDALANDAILQSS
jgi:predicted NAD/FAD-binding protein